MRWSGWVCLIGLVGGVAACGAGATPTVDAGADVARGDVASGMDVAQGFDAEQGLDAPPGPDAPAQCPDMDDDGHGALPCGDDCDDNDRRRYPGLREVCDGEGRDEDCNPCTVGEVSPGGVGGDSDQDEDGFPSNTCFNRITGESMPVCDAATSPDGGEPVARVRVNAAAREVRGADCNDRTRTRNPAVSERCDAESVDENCNGTANEGCECPTIDHPEVSRACVGTAGVCATGTQDCVDGRWGMCSISPTPETCNERDDDCNGMVDEGLRVECYRDGDGDGYALVDARRERVCASPAGSTTCPPGYTARDPAGAGGADCDDMNPARAPALTEVCNGFDDDCDGMSDEGLRTLCYRDVDGDGYASAGTGGTQQCGVMLGGVLQCPPGYTAREPVLGAADCNDESAVQAPGLMEVKCNGRNDDCNAATTDECDMPGATCANNCGCPTGSIACRGTCLAVPTAPCSAGIGECTRPGEYVCDPSGNGGRGSVVCSAMAAAPTTETYCNGRDENCNGMADDRACPSGQSCNASNVCACPGGQVVCGTGSCMNPPRRCTVGVGACARDVDQVCNAMTNRFECPPATETNTGTPTPEVCNGIDDNCDGTVDESVIPQYWRDCDGDGYGRQETPVSRCTPMARCNGRTDVTNQGDCNDDIPTINPVGTETCNGRDDNCDNRIDNFAGANCIVNATSSTLRCGFYTIRVCPETCVLPPTGIVTVPDVTVYMGDNADPTVTVSGDISGTCSRCGTANREICCQGTLGVVVSNLARTARSFLMPIGTRSVTLYATALVGTVTLSGTHIASNGAVTSLGTASITPSSGTSATLTFRNIDCGENHFTVSSIGSFRGTVHRIVVNRSGVAELN